MEIKIYLTNLGKYNEGSLVGEWFTLPIDMKEAGEIIGLNEQYEEYFITDYEAPFQINEYSNIDKLNEIAEQLEYVELPKKNNGFYEVEDVLNFISELESEGLIQDSIEYIGDIIHDDQLDEMVNNMIDNSNGWLRVKFFLQNACNNSDYHKLDGYANITRLGKDDLENIVKEALEEIRNL